MKKILVYIFAILCVIVLLPSIFTKKRQDIISNQNNDADLKEKQEEPEKYDYSKYATIKLYHAKNSEIEELSIDEYLYGVVSSEMPASYEEEALKAQAIVARTYTLYQIINSKSKHGDADICDDYKCCQAWISKEERLSKWEENEKFSNWDKIVNAVDLTQGKIITYEGKPIDAFFHSNSGGKTEVVSNVWGGADLPYLKSVETSGEDVYNQYASEVILNKDELSNKVKEKYNDFIINLQEDEAIKITAYTESGRVRTLKIGNINISGTEARTLFGLKSTNFTVSIEGENIKFSVIGYGHGVGMSQTGANTMAQSRMYF